MKLQTKIWTQSVLSIMLTVGLAQAQSQTAPAVPAGPISVAPNGSVAAPAATPVTITPEMRAAIKELLELTRFKDNMRNAYQSMAQTLPVQMAQMINNSIQQNTSLSDEQKKQLRDRLTKSFEPVAKDAVAILQDPKLIEDATNNVYPIYAKYFSLTEIKQMVAFYKTPVGAKSVTNMPLLVNDTMRGAMAVLQPRVIPMTENLLKKEVEAVQKNGPAK